MIAELIAELLEKGIYLSNNGGKLSVEYNGEAIDDELLSKIKSNKEQLLTYLSADEVKNEYQKIERVEKSDAYPMSSAQRRIWILCQFEEVSKVYNMPNTIYLDGQYDIENFTKAIHATVNRHEILRTIFKPDETGELKQWVLEKEDLGFEVNVKDLSRSDKKNEEVRKFIANDAHVPFNLEKCLSLQVVTLKQIRINSVQVRK